MDPVERRAEKRIRPPGDAVLDFALWAAEPDPPCRLPIGVLGAPSACRRVGDRLVLVDVAAIGLGLHVHAAPESLPRLAQAPALNVYLKLRDYRSQSPSDMLSLFFYARNVRANLRERTIDLGLRLLRQGRGSSFEKSLEMLDVSRFGSPSLAAWIDAVVRRLERPRQHSGPGLDLDHLLDEPAFSIPLPDM